MSDFKKGSPQFEFFADFYKYAAKYFTPGPTIAWWDGMVHDANDIVRKYEKADLKTGMMARALMCGFSDYITALEKKARETNEVEQEGAGGESPADQNGNE